VVMAGTEIDGGVAATAQVGGGGTGVPFSCPTTDGDGDSGGGERVGMVVEMSD
jgi:hypothetical protein